METNKFFDLYLDEAIKIHAICFDLNLSTDDAKLYSFIHIRGLESKQGTNYFRKERSEDITPLEILLGKDKEIIQEKLNSLEELKESFENIFVCNKINKLDEDAEENFGRESYLKSELSQRLRIYTDILFRNKKLKFYENAILPKIKDYTQDKVNQSFQKQNEKERIEEENLKDLFE
ncbi:MAG: hypothetical protein Q7S33_02975 [Nanoarchaeota archaeon]|nr:hypothetical protein [Nanoarchaeota archaeon]